MAEKNEYVDGLFRPFFADAEFHWRLGLLARWASQGCPSVVDDPLFLRLNVDHFMAQRRSVDDSDGHMGLPMYLKGFAGVGVGTNTPYPRLFGEWLRDLQAQNRKDLGNAFAVYVSRFLFWGVFHGSTFRNEVVKGDLSALAETAVGIVNKTLEDCNA